MPSKVDLTGRQFARLTVIKQAEHRRGHVVWECLCSCGNTVIIQSAKLNNGHTKSCGCLMRETAAERSHARKAIAPDDATKECSKCHQEKSLDAFYPQRKGKYGRMSECIDCQVKRSNVYKKNHQEETAKKLKEWRGKNADRVREKNAAYKKANPEYFVAYTQANAIRLRANALRWKLANPDKVRAAKHRRRTHETQAGGSFTDKQWKALCEQYDHRCLCCGEQKKLSADHIIPVSKGGSSDISNIQPLCMKCNRSKAARTIDYRTQYETNNELSVWVGEVVC